MNISFFTYSLLKIVAPVNCGSCQSAVGFSLLRLFWPTLVVGEGGFQLLVVVLLGGVGCSGQSNLLWFVPSGFQ